MFRDVISRHKIITSLIALLFLTFVGFAIYTAISRIGKEPVEVFLVPTDTVYILDGQRLRNGTTYLKPGTYSVSASREGFTGFEGEVTIGQPNTTTIGAVLQPETEEARQWKEENQQLYFDAERIGGQEATAWGARLAEENPIISVLPFSNFIYTIGYRADPDDPSGNSIIVTVNAATGGRNAAVDKIRELGFEPTDYKIMFRNFENPFNHE